MNKEIKEILDRLKGQDNDYHYCLKKDISFNDNMYCSHILLDYITNLQQNLKDMTDINLENEKELTNLQQENQRLEENNQNMQEEMARVWEENERLKQELKDRPFIDYTTDVYEELEDYKLRCEKAIEYIKKEKENYLTKGSSIADTNNANLIVSAAVNTCDCSLNILQNGSEKDDK